MINTPQCFSTLLQLTKLKSADMLCKGREYINLPIFSKLLRLFKRMQFINTDVEVVNICTHFSECSIIVPHDR